MGESNQRFGAPSLLLHYPMAAVSLSVSTVKPLGDRVFVKVSESEEKTAGGILLPDTAKEKPQVGEVVQVGPGKRNDDGSRQSPEVGVGDKVLYSKYAGTDIKLGSDEFVLLSATRLRQVGSHQLFLSIHFRPHGQADCFID